MRLAILAVGARMPRWVDEGFGDYARRMPRELAVDLTEIRPEPRAGGKPVAALLAAEAARLRQARPRGARLVCLDERGRELTTTLLSARLADWLAAGGDAALMIGGPDGLAPELKAEADELWRLSGLTLPHGLVRVVLAEALYRAASLLKNHPYHRA